MILSLMFLFKGLGSSSFDVNVGVDVDVDVDVVNVLVLKSDVSFAGVFAQVLTSLGFLDFHQLNYFTLVSVTLATIVSWFLPPIKNRF